jgi:hypothetical protein
MTSNQDASYTELVRDRSLFVIWVFGEDGVERFRFPAKSIDHAHDLILAMPLNAATGHELLTLRIQSQKTGRGVWAGVHVGLNFESEECQERAKAAMSRAEIQPS